MNYLMRYKGKYRLLCELDQNTNDFPRDDVGNIDDTDVYISCQYGNKIFTYGHIDNKRPVWLWAFIPSIGRGHNIIKALNDNNIEYIDHVENDEEVEFKFKASDIEIVADIMKARTSGAGISPFSSRNLPKTKIEIPTDKIERYKEITKDIPKCELLCISRATNDFLDNIMAKSLCKGSKKKSATFDVREDMKKMKLSRQSKEYIFIKGYFNEYLEYLQNKLKEIYG